ncbi:hypothetical protein GQR58_030101 [Nymphon striatum]|nr:hypothetical protein GQR58_030101 [Nymphon striatum]
MAFGYSESGEYKVTGGPSTRRVIDFSDIENSMSIIPTGQSGNPFSKHYQDQAEMFLNVFVSNWAIAQNDTIRVSLDYTEAKISDVLQSIEEQSPYQFYYVDAWLGDQLVSGTYQNSAVQQVLGDLFENTILNFYILDNEKIILTQNNIIYDELPNRFFESSKQRAEQITEIDNTGKTLNPVFFADEQLPQQLNIETVRIGKETLNDQKRTYKLSGYVKNAKTGRPIPDLSLVVKNRRIGTVTDENGFYEIDLPVGENLFETKALGIESQQKRILIYNEADKAKNVEEEITGSTTIESEETKDIPMVLGERNILSVATTLPGITNAGEGASGLNVRGGKTDQNLILIR